MRSSRAVLLVTALAALALAGCSADTGRLDDGGSAGVVAEEEAAVDGAAPVGDGTAGDDAAGEAGGAAQLGSVGQATADRQLARTARISLQVDDVAAAADEVARVTADAGGFVSDAQVQAGDFGHGSLTLRVPAEELDDTVATLGELGERVVSTSLSTEDLTDQLTDLGARIDNLQRLEDELVALLGEVRDSDPQAHQLLAVFERINQVRGDIERLQAQRAAAADRVALATVHVELLATATAPEPVEPAPEDTLGRALSATQAAFVRIGDALIWLVVTVLPVGAVLLAGPALAGWALLRRRRRRGAAATAPPATTTAAPAGSPSGAATDEGPTG